MRFSFQIDLSHQLDDKLGEVDNFQAWKYMISLKKMNWTPTQVERFQFQREMRLETLHKKNLVKAKKIMVDSVMDQLVPQVSSLKTPKMFDSLTKLFKGKNMNQNMTLRNQLKNVKIQNAETIQSYFKRVSQIKEQLIGVKEEVKNV